MIERKRERTARIGLFAVGHGKYWEQFDGLLDSLLAYHGELVDRVAAHAVEIVDFGMVDSAQKGFAVAAQIRAANLDLLLCNMVTYATSSVFAPILRDSHVPVVLVALQPRSGLDYTRASTFMQLQNDNICSVPEFMGVANRFGKKIYDVIIGTLHGDADAEREIAEWCDIAKVLHALKGARIGLMGHVLESMYDMHADPTAVASAFGVHVPLLEIEDLVRLYEKVSEEEITREEARILAEFDTPSPQSDPVTVKLTDADLRQAAHTAAALYRLVEEQQLTGLAYYYEGNPDTIQRRIAMSLIVGNSILNGEGVPMCGEYDLKTCIAMLILDRLDIGGSFAELHPFDFAEDFILVGHDGPHHIRIASDRPVLRSLTKYHGKPGQGASVEFKIQEGPITLRGITQTGSGAFKFVIGEGYSKEGPIPPTGNTNTRAFFAPTTKEFVKKWVMEGPTHHFALGVGHRADTLKKIADILGVESVIVKG